MLLLLVQGPMLRSHLTWDNSCLMRKPGSRRWQARPCHPRRQEPSHLPGLQGYQRGALLSPKGPEQASPPSLPPPVWPSTPALRRPLHPPLFAFLEPVSAWAVGMSMRAALCSRPPGPGPQWPRRAHLAGPVTHASSWIPGNAFPLLLLLLPPPFSY